MWLCEFVQQVIFHALNKMCNSNVCGGSTLCSQCDNMYMSPVELVRSQPCIKTPRDYTGQGFAGAYGSAYCRVFNENFSYQDPSFGPPVRIYLKGHEWFILAKSEAVWLVRSWQVGALIQIFHCAKLVIIKTKFSMCLRRRQIERRYIRALLRFHEIPCQAGDCKTASQRLKRVLDVDSQRGQRDLWVTPDDIFVLNCRVMCVSKRNLKQTAMDANGLNEMLKDCANFMDHWVVIVDKTDSIILIDATSRQFDEFETKCAPALVVAHVSKSNIVQLKFGSFVFFYKFSW